MTKWAHKHIWFEHVLDNNFLKDKYINKENIFKDVDLSSKKRIVCVGCGSMPETMIYLYEHFKTQEIIGIDNNFEAVYIANQLISHLWITNINIIHSDWAVYDYTWADFVYIAALVTPKDKVVTRITQTTDDNVEISVVIPRFLSDLVLDTITIEKHPRLRMTELYGQWDLTRSSKKFVLLTKYKY